MNLGASRRGRKGRGGKAAQSQIDVHSHRCQTAARFTNYLRKSVLICGFFCVPCVLLRLFLFSLPFASLADVAKGEMGRLVLHSFSDGGSLLCVKFSVLVSLLYCL